MVNNIPQGHFAWHCAKLSPPIMACHYIFYIHIHTHKHKQIKSLPNENQAHIGCGTVPTHLHALQTHALFAKPSACRDYLTSQGIAFRTCSVSRTSVYVALRTVSRQPYHCRQSCETDERLRLLVKPEMLSGQNRLANFVKKKKMPFE